MVEVDRGFEDMGQVNGMSAMSLMFLEAPQIPHDVIRS